MSANGTSMPSGTPANTLPLAPLVLLFAGAVLTIAPHALWLPWWVDGVAGGLLVWRFWLAVRGGALPARWLLALVTAVAAVGVYLSYRTIMGRDAGVTLIVLLLSLKLLESRSRRDIFIAAFLVYFVALAGFFYSQSMQTAGWMLVTVLINTAALVGFSAPARPIADNLNTAGRMLIEAGPVMLLLFFLFPRVQGPLWGLPQDAYSGITGLSDTMSPGSISQLSTSDAIAFRVKFQGAAPPRNRLYWRGPVLSEFDGKTWRAGFPRLNREPLLEVRGAPIDYEVTLEPHNRNWLFTLEMPGRIPPNARETSDYLVLSLPPVRSRIRYEARSYLDYRATAGADARDLALELRLPRDSNPRARALAGEWRQSLGNDTAIVGKGIEFFRASRFEYTLLPPLLGMNSVDEFLFDTKQGFCEHFAASFVFLMRAAGIPARVVTGYQGGDTNPVDDYMVVRQADAHAWAEVWLPQNGWTRVDPTAAAFPIRVESGVAAAARGAAALPLLLRTNIDWLKAMRNNWEALANKWNQWVLGYNPDRQREILSWLGVQQPSWQTMAMMLFWSVAGVLLLIALWLLRGIRHVDPVQGAWLRFCQKLARAGLARDGAEGPLDYAGRLARQLPGRAPAVRAIVQLYVELRYGSRGERHSLARLKQLVRQFKP